MASDNSFGPQLQADFDFTLLFEHTILSILPSALLLLAAPLSILRLVRKPVIVRPGVLLWAKLAVASVLFGSELAAAVLWSRSRRPASGSGLAAAAVSCAAAASIGALALAEHRRSLRPSTLLSVYLSVAVLCDAARTRSLFRRPDLRATAGLAATAVAAKAVILLLEEVPKRRLLRSPARVGPEATSGFWNRSLFVWLNPTLLRGFHGIIRVQDLQAVGSAFSSERLLAAFEPCWTAANKRSAHCLVTTCLRALFVPFLAILLPRLCFTGFKFAQPLLLRSVVQAVGQRNPSQDVVAGLVGATVLVYLGMAVSKACYKHLVFRHITMLRGVLVSAIFNKTLVLEHSAAQEAQAATLMSTDVDGIEMGLSTFHDIWGSVVELALGVYMLATVVGGASFLVVVPAVATTLASFAVSIKLAPARVAWNEKIQARVSITADVLAQIKGIKMSGIAPAVSDHIQGLRVVEVEYSVKMRRLLVFMHAMGNFSSAITPVVVIAGGLFWTSGSSRLTAAETFTTLSIVALVSDPLIILLMAYPQFASTLGCFQRIQAFLLSEERMDRRKVRAEASSTAASLSGAETGSQSLALGPTKQTFLTATTRADGCVVELVDASVSAGGDAEPILRNVNLRLMPSTLTMVVGPVGSGKSTLLKAILGEAQLSQGSISVHHASLAYCGQTSWLRNVSVRDNVLGESPWIPSWYQTVLHACLLDEDVQWLPEGDASLAGSGGVNLSGGQKQRIALARAIYSRKSVLILDDVFSALDCRTSRATFARLFGNDGILRNKTVIMTTHLLEHVAEADTLLVLDGKGNVSEQQATQDAFQNDSLKKAGDLEDDDNSSESQAATPEAKPPPEEQEQESAERQRGDWGLYYFYLRSVGRLLFAVWIVAVISSAALDRMPQIWVRIWLERDPGNNLYFAGYAALGMTSFVCATGMLALYMLKLVPTSCENLHWQLLDAVMKATLQFLTSTDSGSILNRFSQDMTLVSQALPMSFMNVAYLCCCTVADLAIIASGAKFAAALIPLFAAAFYLVQRFYLRTSRQMRHLDLEAKSPLYGFVIETSAGVQHIRAFGWQARCLKRGLELLNRSQTPYYYMFCIQRWLTLVLDLCVLAMAVVLVALALSFTHTTTESAIGLALVNVISFSEMLSQLIDSWVELETSLGTIARLRTFVGRTPFEREPGADRAQVPEGWPQQGRIELKSVSARYSDTTRPVLDDVSVVIQPGEKVGIVGRSGSGKSSLILTLLGLLDYEGSVTIDGVDLSRVPRQQLRSRITTLPQDPVEVPGSVRDNLVPFAPKGTGDHGAMAEALARVGLWEHVSSRGGLDAELASMGLSHGQKQLLCLARALLHRASTGSRVVLVDEATGSMDCETDARMQAVMGEAFAGCTVVVIAHRLETLRDADVVVELKEGRLALVRSQG